MNEKSVISLLGLVVILSLVVTGPAPVTGAASARSSQDTAAGSAVAARLCRVRACPESFVFDARTCSCKRPPAVSLAAAFSFSGG